MKCQTCKFNHICDGRIVKLVGEHCKRYKSVEQTNEEWLKSCTTEQLAELLYKFYCDGRNDELQRYVSINEKSFVEWLKECHNAKQ